MENFFYLLTILALIWEGINISDTKNMIEYKKTVETMENENRNLLQILLPVFLLGYWIWCFIGLFTFQWPIFLIIILMGFIGKETVLRLKIDAIITFILLLFIIINASHLKIDIYESIKNLIK